MNKIFHVLSGQLHVIVNIHPFLSFRPATHSKKKLGQEQFRASNEVNWLNNDVF